mgnify:CR=1 FL=1
MGSPGRHAGPLGMGSADVSSISLRSPWRTGCCMEGYNPVSYWYSLRQETLANQDLRHRAISFHTMVGPRLTWSSPCNHRASLLAAKFRQSILLRHRATLHTWYCPTTRNTFGSIWGHFGVTLGSLWGHIRVTLGSFLDHFGITLGSLWMTLG